MHAPTPHVPLNPQHEDFPVHPEPALFYDPPYERPLEDEFAWHLVKYIAPVGSLRYQTPAQTPDGNFWVDFVVETPLPFGKTRRIGFEIGDLDGGFITSGPDAPHELTIIEHDDRRDALVMASGCYDALYCFTAANVLYNLHDCLYVISHLEEDLFSLRGSVNLDALTSLEAKVAQINRDKAVSVIPVPVPDEQYSPYGQPSLIEPPRYLAVKHLFKDRPDVWTPALDRCKAAL